MQFTVKRPYLVEKLERAKNICARKSTIPILAHVKLKLDSENLQIVATDLDMTYHGSIATVEAEGSGEICLPAQKLYEIVRAMPESDIRFTLAEDGKKCAVESGKARFRLAAEVADNFPATNWEEVDLLALTFEPSTLRHALLQTIYATTEEAARFTLNNLLFHVLPDNQVQITGTDGHRLARATIECQEIEGDGPRSFMVAAKAVQNWLSIKGELGPVKIASVKNAIRLEAGDHGTFYFRVAVGQYPKTEIIFDSARDNDRAYEFDAEPVAAAIRRALLVADDRSHAVRLGFCPDKVIVTAETAEAGASVEEVVIEQLRGSNDVFRVGLNGGYVVDVLSRQEGKIRMTASRPDNAIYFQVGQVEALVMPLRV